MDDRSRFIEPAAPIPAVGEARIEREVDQSDRGVKALTEAPARHRGAIEDTLFN